MAYIFDSHVHIFHPKVVSQREEFFDDSSFRLLYSCSKSRLTDKGGLDEYFKSFGVEKAAVMGFPWFSNKYCEMQNEYFSSVSERLPCFGSIPLSADSSTIKSFAVNIKNLGLTGIGEIGFYCKGMDRNAQKWLVTVLEESAKNNLKVCLHVNEPVGHHYTGKYDPKLPELLKIISKFPDLKIILAHLGGGLVFYELMPEIKDILKNCVYDTAAVPFLYSDNVYKAAVDLVGEERLLFGSDFPLLNADRYLQLYGKDLIMRDNFKKFFGLQ